MMSDDQEDGFGAPLTHDADLSIGFDQLGQYSYGISMRECGEGRMAWNTSEISDGSRSVAFHYELDSEVIDTTVTGSIEAISDELFATSAHPFLRVAFYPSVSLFADETELTVGDRIAFPMEEGTGTVEITGTPTHAGIECYSSVWRYDGEIRHRDCIAPDRRLVFHASTYTTDSADPLLTIELLQDDSAL